jgi:spore germination protein GerM
MTRRPLAVLATTLALAACGNGSDKPTPQATQSSTPPVTSSPTTSPTQAPGSMTVAVYYLGKGADARLYREFRKVPRATAVVRTAVSTMLHNAPLDPDYRSVWPTGTTVNGISVAGSVATIDLSASARSRTATAAVEKQSLQQLVHTVTAAAPNVTGIRLRFDGATKPTLWGHVSTTGTITRAAQIDTLAFVWVESPAQGARVGHSLAVKGTASVFEATVSWSLRTAAGATVRTGSSNATQGAPGRGPWSVTVAIPANVTGNVVFTAWESSAKDGSVQYADTKTFTVA